MPGSIGRFFAVVFDWFGIFVIVVFVLTDVEVEMEEAGAKLAVPMPIAEGVQTQTTG